MYLGNYPTCGASYPVESYGIDNTIVIPIRYAYTYKCDWTTPMFESPYKYIDYVMIHEIIHAMGFVPSYVSNSGTQGHVTGDRNDIMWGGNSGYRNDLSSNLHIGDSYINLLKQSPYLI